MAWMARDPERRLDPARILPGARSIICVVKNYQSPGAHSDDPRTGRISALRVGRRLPRRPDGEAARASGSTSSGWAATRRSASTPTRSWRSPGRARGPGLAGQALQPDLAGPGSWFFLGEVLTDLDLDADAAHAEEYCGTCTACIDLCPTKAIVAPYVVDSRKCIAYLTIENRGPIPRELRPLMGNRRLRHLPGRVSLEQVREGRVRAGILRPRREPDAVAHRPSRADAGGVQPALQGQPGEARQARRLPSQRRGRPREFQRSRRNPRAGAGAGACRAAGPRPRRIGPSAGWAAGRRWRGAAGRSPIRT